MALIRENTARGLPDVVMGLLTQQNVRYRNVAINSCGGHDRFHIRHGATERHTRAVALCHAASVSVGVGLVTRSVGELQFVAQVRHAQLVGTGRVIAAHNPGFVLVAGCASTVVLQVVSTEVEGFPANIAIDVPLLEGSIVGFYLKLPALIVSGPRANGTIRGLNRSMPKTGITLPVST